MCFHTPSSSRRKYLLAPYPLSTCDGTVSYTLSHLRFWPAGTDTFSGSAGFAPEGAKSSTTMHTRTYTKRHGTLTTTMMFAVYWQNWTTSWVWLLHRVETWILIVIVVVVDSKSSRSSRWWPQKSNLRIWSHTSKYEYLEHVIPAVINPALAILTSNSFLQPFEDANSWWKWHTVAGAYIYTYTHIFRQGVSVVWKQSFFSFAQRKYAQIPAAYDRLLSGSPGHRRLRTWQASLLGKQKPTQQARNSYKILLHAPLTRMASQLLDTCLLTSTPLPDRYLLVCYLHSPLLAWTSGPSPEER